MTKERWQGILLVTATLLILYSIAVIFTRAPIEVEMREAQKIFYFHAPSGWVMFVAFTVTAVWGVVYLRNGSLRADAIAGASAEIGFLLATIVLVTGSLWGRSAWNTWWNWEPRLTSMLVLWVIYAAYLLLRNSLQGEKRRRHSSVFGILAAVMVPIVYYSVNWWGSLLHPPTSTVRNLDAGMYFPFFFSVFTMHVFYFALLWIRSDLEMLENQVKTLRESRIQ